MRRYTCNDDGWVCAVAVDGDLVVEGDQDDALARVLLLQPLQMHVDRCFHALKARYVLSAATLSRQVC